MILIRTMAAATLALLAASAEQMTPGDARRGEELFRTEQCIQCHSLNGRGGGTAPDLAQRIDRNYTPTVMASLMWNHAPAMWAAMRKQGVAQPRLTTEQASDLFSYFVSARYFELPGDAARGKQAFASRHCAECHGISESKAAGAPPVAKWESLSDPIILAQQMWNHGAKMKEAFAARKLSRPSLTGQELKDVMVYLQNLPETRSLVANFELPPSSNAELFQSKGCVDCHTGRLALEDRLRNQTLTQIAADMWNHQPSMRQPPPHLSQQEMRGIIGHLWVKQYFRGAGNAERGKKVFADKRCATCHNDPSSGAPKLGKGKDGYSAITIVSALWGHGPQMLDRMSQKGIEWPRFTAPQMSDLIAFLNSY